jgi:hypothetical protein
VSERYTRTWAAAVDYLHWCTDCGSVILDRAAHDRWHATLADVWAWIDRVSGSSCETARNALGEQ